MTVAMLAPITTHRSLRLWWQQFLFSPFFVDWDHSTFSGTTGYCCYCQQWLFKRKDTRNTKACQDWDGESCVTVGKSKQTSSAQWLHFTWTACQMQSYALSLTKSSINKCHLFRVFAGPDLAHLLLTSHKSCFEEFLIECADTHCIQSYFQRTFGEILLAAITWTKDVSSMFYTSCS